MSFFGAKLRQLTSHNRDSTYPPLKGDPIVGRSYRSLNGMGYDWEVVEAFATRSVISRQGGERDGSGSG